ncbi:MAG: hypothetical protein JOY61_08355, partial [Chloroflexi bacterium]|nr:hypothetical protein [Chloroflexota bacterium]
MKRVLSLLVAGVILISFAPSAVAHAARPGGGISANNAAGTITVLVGQGQFSVSPGSVLGYAPRYVDITAGDTVVFKDVDNLEPHTVSFGPLSLLKQLTNDIFLTKPQTSGPPVVTVNPKAALPTPGNTFDGSGFANSGILNAGQSWRLTFTQPGTYRYICLIHGEVMYGVVVVHPAQQGHTWIVQSGDGQAAVNDKANNTVNDSFYPRHLTIHVGDSVMWTPGFHTVTFAPEAMLQQLEKTFITPMPQPSGGPPQLVVNSKVILPSGGPTY